MEGYLLQCSIHLAVRLNYFHLLALRCLKGGLFVLNSFNFAKMTPEMGCLSLRPQQLHENQRNYIELTLLLTFILLLLVEDLSLLALY